MRHLRHFGILMLGAASSLGAQAALPHYHVTTSIRDTSSILGPEPFLSADPTHRRLYGLGNLVVDIDRDLVIDTMSFPGAGGYVLAPDMGRGLARTGKVFDLKTFAVTGTVHGSDIDGGVYDPVTHRAFLLSDMTTVVDMTTGKEQTQVNLGAAAWGTADGKGYLFISVDHRSLSIIKVNTTSLRVEQHYDVPGCNALHGGVTMDRETRRLFFRCYEGLAVVNADNGQLVTMIPVPRGAHTFDFDPITKLIFILADGKLTVIHEEGPNTYRIVQQLPMVGQAAVVDPQTHKVYGLDLRYANGENTGILTIAIPGK